jgi:hypothetical protein
MSSTPIADHAFLSDRHSCALVDRAGSVEWLCFPRFDGPSVFARLLDDDAGHWQVQPEAEWSATRRYAGRSLALETTFRTADGELVLTDALGLGPDNGGHRLGSDVPHVLVRRLACTSGELDVLVDYRPRPEYGLIVPLLSHLDGGVAARGGADWLVLTLPAEADLQDGRARARLHLRAGDVVHLALQRSTHDDGVEPEQPDGRGGRSGDRGVRGGQRRVVRRAPGGGGHRAERDRVVRAVGYGTGQGVERGGRPDAPAAAQQQPALGARRAPLRRRRRAGVGLRVQPPPRPFGGVGGGRQGAGGGGQGGGDEPGRGEPATEEPRQVLRAGDRPDAHRLLRAPGVTVATGREPGVGEEQQSRVHDQTLVRTGSSAGPWEAPRQGRAR